MSWLYSRVLAEEYLGDNCLDGEQSVPLSGNPTPQAYCAPDKMKDFSRISRFGMTFKPLTESRGEELLTLYLEDFRAKTLVAPEKERELTEKGVECGRSSQELLARYNPSTSLWRTAQCSLLEDLEQCLETWPRWGSMRNGACYPQPMLAQTTRERESGFVPDGVNFHHTPNTTGMDGGSNSRKALKKRMEKYWLTPFQIGTPTASMSERSEKFLEGRILSPAEFVRQWPTPIASGSGGGTNINNPRGIHQGNSLASAVKLSLGKWPTPTAHMAKEMNSPSEALRDTPSLASRVGGQLNPMWFEWLMGWPLGWTDLKPSATDKSLCAPQQPLSYLERD